MSAIESLSREQLLDVVRSLQQQVQQQEQQVQQQQQAQRQQVQANATSATTLPTDDKKKRRQRVEKPFSMDKYAIRHVALRVAYLGWSYRGLVRQAETDETIEVGR